MSRYYDTSHHSCYNQMSTSSIAEGVTSPCKTILSTAVEEKYELSGLTDQLANLLTRVRGAKESSSTLDVSSYHSTISGLETELQKVKNLYECELAKLRQKLEETSSCRASSVAMYDSCKAELMELKAKMNSNGCSVQQLEGELCCVRSELTKAKQTICELEASLERSRRESRKVVNYDQLDGLKNSLECEKRMRLEAEDAIAALKEKLTFECRLREQIRGELEERLRVATGQVSSLELKVKESDSIKLDYTDILGKLRAGTAVELERYRSETEVAMNKNLEALRQQFESEKSVRCGLVVEKERMEHTIVDLRAQIADFQGQVAGLLKQKDSLEETLRQERGRACCQIRDLETKLSELNSVMLEKVKECTNAREAQISLKTEIDAFKALLKEGEARIKSTPTVDTTVKRVTTTTDLGCNYEYKCKPYVRETDLYIAPRPPPTPRRITRPTSAHASSYLSTTRIAPADDPVFKSHYNTEYRSSAGTGAVYVSKSRCFDTDDLDIYEKSGKRVTLEFQPDVVKKVSVKDDIEICGKGISACYSTPFPRTYYDTKCGRKNLNEKSSAWSKKTFSTQYY